MMDERRAKTEYPAEDGPPFTREQPVYNIIMVNKHSYTVQQKVLNRQKFHSTQLHCSIAEKEYEINFLPCGEDCHRLCSIINMGQKICRIKILPTRAGGDKGKHFSMQKFPAIHLHDQQLLYYSYLRHSYLHQ